MTPLPFEALYQAEWQELEALLDLVLGRKTKGKDATRARRAANASRRCIGAPASTSRSRGHVPIPRTCSIGSSG